MQEPTVDMPPLTIAGESNIIKPIATQAQTTLVKEDLSKSENLLERSVLIHGFSGNVDPNNPYAEESKHLKKILTNGELISPSLQELDEKEKVRFNVDAPFDKNRITFHVWKGDQQDGLEYISEAFFAAPTTILEGYVPSEDPAWPGRAMSAYNKDGVRIPLERGLLFITPERVNEFHSQIEDLANRSGNSFAEYVNKYVILLPKTAFRDNKILWSIVASRIKPALGVTVKVASAKEQTESIYGLKFTDKLNNYEPAKANELGTTEIQNGSAISPQLSIDLEQRWQAEIDWLHDVEKNMASNPFHIERLRDESTPDFQAIQRLIDQVQQNRSDNNSVPTLAQQYDELRKRLLIKNEQILEQKYPNAPKEEELTGGFKPRRPVVTPTVLRGKDGRLHVYKDDLFD